MNKHLIFKVVTVLFLLTQTFPPINIFLTFSPSLKLASFMVVTIVMFPELITKYSLIALMIYTLETLVYFLFGSKFFDTINSVVIPFMTMSTAMMLTEYVFKYDKDYKFTRLAILFTIGTTTIMSIVSIPILNINPEIIRLAYGSSTSGDAEVLEVSSFIISWNTINGITYLISAIIFLCREMWVKNIKLFIVWTVVFLIFYYIIFRSNIATPFVLSSCMVVVALLCHYERFNKKNISKLVLTSMVGVLLTTPTVLVPILEVAQNNMPYGSTSQRIEEIKETLIYGETQGEDMEARNELYNRSWGLFIESPIIGTQHSENISHHTYFIDRLACFGMFLIIPLVMVFVVHFKSVYKRLNHTKVTYSFCYAVFIFMLIYKNEDAGIYPFFVLPILCRYIEYTMDNNLYRKGLDVISKQK